MKYSRLEKHLIPMTAKQILYIMLAIHIINTVFVNIFIAATITKGLVSLLIIGVLSLIASIGFTSIVLKFPSRWHLWGGGILLIIACIGLLTFSFIYFYSEYWYSQDYGLFHYYPYLLAPFLVTILSWVVSGVIIISDNFFSTKTSESPSHA